MSRVLACLDESTLAPVVYRAALESARARGATLVVLRILLGAAERLESDEVLKGTALAELRRVAPPDPNVPVESRVLLHTSAWQAICAAATDEKADLIVLGAHSHGTIARALGTTAARVVDHAPCSVLVVRAGTSESEAP